MGRASAEGKQTQERDLAEGGNTMVRKADETVILKEFTGQGCPICGGPICHATVDKRDELVCSWCKVVVPKTEEVCECV